MITLDFETKSEADLRKVGPWAYSEHPSTDVICGCWAHNDGDVESWVPGWHTGALETLFRRLKADEEVEAHNYAFELSIWINVMCKKYGWPDPRKFKWRDTMAAAAYYSLPQSLDKLAKALGFGGKDPEGGRLISKYSKLHLKTAKRIIPPEDLKKWIDYCKFDVELERKVGNYLGDLPTEEQRIFDMDRVINMRGLMLDEAGINVAHQIVTKRAEKLTLEFKNLTGVNPSQRDKYLEWLKNNDLELPNLQAGTVDEFLETAKISLGIKDEVVRSLEIRSKVNKASTKKLDAMLRQRGQDGRARFQTRYHGAGTGRWTGSGFQPLNLARGFEDVSPEQLVRDVMQGDCDWLDAVYGDATDAVSKASRHWIIPAPGNKIVAGDFVSVEAVILACLAGEQWKIDAFARGDKIYELTADKIYKLPPGTVTKKTHPKERFDGKTCLGASTRVLTHQGWKRIIEVSINDQLWDGKQWISHEGLIYQGKKKVINLAGVEMTPDHKILAGKTWVEAGQAVSSENMRSLILGIGMESLPSVAINGGLWVVCSPSGFSALAERASTLFQKAIYAKGELLGVLNVLRERLLSGVRSTLGTLIYARTISTDGGCLIVSRPLLPDVDPERTRTMEKEGSEFLRNGELGQKAAELTYPTSSVWMGGMTQNWKLTALTMIKGMLRGTYASLQKMKTRLIKGRFQNSNVGLMNWKPVYDLVNAGPNRRFTILTDDGPVIVHNCELAFGYQGAVGAWRNFDSSDRHTDEDIQEIKNIWRSEHPATVEFWADMEWAAIEAVKNPGREIQVNDKISFQIIDEWLSMRLPNGKRIWYFDPQLRTKMPPWHDPIEDDQCAEGNCRCQPGVSLTYMAQKEGRWRRVDTYGGKLVENATQAVSREILIPAMFRVESAGYPIILTVYDEIVSEVPADYGSIKEFKRLLEIREPWAENWPITADVWEGLHYKK